MLNFLKQLNTNLNLFEALSKKLSRLVKFLKARKLLSLSLALLLLLLSWLGWQRFGPKKITDLYELATVTRQDLKKTVIASGKIKSQTQIDLKFQTSGQLAWVGVKEGDQVKAWQAIASLDQRELKKTLEKYLRDYSKERNDFEEDVRETYTNQVITDTIKRVLEKNQWDLDKAVLDVELKDIALRLATLITPIKGIVTHIDVPVAGVNITPATAVFTVADPNQLYFEAVVDELDIGLIAASQSAELVLDAYPDEKIPLTVEAIEFTSTLDSSGSTVFLVKLNLSNNQGQKYKLGMNGEVSITVAEKTDVLAVPLSAIIEDGQAYVQAVQGKRLVDQPVSLGLTGENYVEITSGLTESQTIVVSKKTRK